MAGRNFLYNATNRRFTQNPEQARQLGKCPNQREQLMQRPGEGSGLQIVGQQGASVSGGEGEWGLSGSQHVRLYWSLQKL